MCCNLCIFVLMSYLVCCDELCVVGVMLIVGDFDCLVMFGCFVGFVCMILYFVLLLFDGCDDWCMCVLIVVMFMFVC